MLIPLTRYPNELSYECKNCKSPHKFPAGLVFDMFAFPRCGVCACTDFVPLTETIKINA